MCGVDHFAFMKKKFPTDDMIASVKDALTSPQLDVSPALGSGGAFAGFDPSWDGRREISDFNRFMDTIFRRMNAAIAQRHLDPMDLEILPKMIKEYKTKNKSKRPR